ncbi:MAG: hypothetical protein V9E81_03610 [Marmoricola sp.]
MHSSVPYLIKLLVRRELAKRYSASVLGLLWSYIQPAIRFGVYYVVFGYLLKMHKDVPDFAIHLFCGIVFVHYFSETFGGGTRSIWVNRSMINKLAMPREVFPALADAGRGLPHVAPVVVAHRLLSVLWMGSRCHGSCCRGDGHFGDHDFLHGAGADL